MVSEWEQYEMSRDGRKLHFFMFDIGLNVISDISRSFIYSLLQSKGLSVEQRKMRRFMLNSDDTEKLKSL